MAILGKIRLPILFLSLYLSGISLAASQELQLVEQEIKAGLLYNFLKYIDWPESANTSAQVTVCLLGDDPFKEYLRPMQSRSVKQKNISLYNLKSHTAVERCHLLYISADAKDQWMEFSPFISGKSILTVGDFNGFIDLGGMIEFNRIGKHIGVNINPAAMRAVHLNVQERLLKLVTIAQSGKE